jgi:microcystin-dependent protein
MIDGPEFFRLLDRLRSWIFFRDRDITLVAGRVLDLNGGDLLNVGDSSGIEHNDLNGLSSGDDHPQYTRRDILTTKGDIYARTAGAVTRVGVGTDGQVLIADSAQASGLAWSTPAGGNIPIGGIILWSGAIASIPAGWNLCDGSAGTPDLRDRFVVGAGSSYAVGATGGVASNNLQHSHGAGTLGADSGGSHTHGAGTLGADNDTHSHLLLTGGDPITYSGPNDQYQTQTDTDTHGHNISGSTASGGSHTHNVSGSSASGGSATQENRPPYYALAFIMRIS